MSTAPGEGVSRAITLDQWIALNDEMAALVRAGIPLDRGLISASKELRGAAGGLAKRLGQRISEGRSLQDALADEGENLPDLYRAVVEAGVRSGRLSQALESMAVFASGVAETRRAIGLALFYPLLVMILAYSLFVAFVLFILPRFVATFESFHLRQPVLVRGMEFLGESAYLWVPVFPIVLLLLGVAWIRSSRASQLRPGRVAGLLRWVPGLGSILSNAQAANVADVLSLLVEQGEPMGRALRLASDASGDPAVRRAGLELAEAIEQGQGGSGVVRFEDRSGAFPPLLRWVLATSTHHPDLASALRHVGGTYRQRASRLAESIQAILPALMLLSLGAVTVLIYALTVFGPMAALWYDLASPTIGEQ